MWFTVLGALRAHVHRSDAEALPLGPPANRRLLAMLCTDPGRAIGLPTLIDALWPDGPPANAVKTVQVYVYRLRRVLGPDRIVRSGGGYALVAGTDEVDAGLFRELAHRADAALTQGDQGRALESLDEALALWSGEPFAEFPALEAVGPEARRLTELRARVVERRVGLLLEQDDPATVVPELFGLVAADPYREGLRGLLMTALYRSGRQADALEQYRLARELFTERLGVEPGVALRDLHERILRNDPALAPGNGTSGPARPAGPIRPNGTITPNGAVGSIGAASPVGTTSAVSPAGVGVPPPVQLAPPAQLPAPLGSFSGRRAELAELVGSPTRVVIVDGMPGVGKSALVTQAAHALASDFPDGQLFVDLHGFAEGMAPDDPAGVLERLLRAVGVPSERIPPELEDRSALWRGTLAHRRVLLVLDNAGSEAQVRPLLPGTDGCRVLITSRRRMPGLDDVQPLSLSTLPEADACRLFATVAGIDRPDVPDEAVRQDEAIRQVVRLCGQLPLAVRLAAARLRSRAGWRVSDLLRRLNDQHDRLGQLDAGDRTVRGAFELSYGQLNPAQQSVFRLLGLHPGADLDGHTAAALVGRGFGETQRVLEDLVDQHLLQSPAYGRYTFHDLLRSHAMQKVREDEPAQVRERARQRLYEHYLAAATSAMDAYAPNERHRWERPDPSVTTVPEFRDRAEALTWLDAERANLVALASEQPPGTERQIANLSICLMRYFETGSHYFDAQQLHRQALRAARAIGSARHEARALNNLGGTLVAPGLHTEAEACFRRAAELSAEVGDLGSAARSWINAANVLQLASDPREALAFAERAIELLQTRNDDPMGLSAALNQATIILLLLGRIPEAEEAVGRALATARDAGLPYERGTALKNYGSVRFAAGRFAESFEYYRDAVDALRGDGPLWTVALTMAFAGDALRELGRIEEALRWQHEALELANRGGNRLVLSGPLCGLGETLIAAGRLEEAIRYLLEVLVVIDGLVLPHDQARARKGLGMAYRAQGRLADAREELRAAYELCRELDLPAAEELLRLLDELDLPAYPASRLV